MLFKRKHGSAGGAGAADDAGFGADAFFLGSFIKALSLVADANEEHGLTGVFHQIEDAVLLVL